MHNASAHRAPRSRTRATLQTRLLLLLSALFLLTLIALGIGMSSVISQSEQASWRDRQIASAESASRLLSAFLDRSWSSLRLVASFDAEELRDHPQLMRRVLDSNPALIEVVRFDERGRALGSATQNSPLLTNLYSRTREIWFTDALAGRRHTGRIQPSADFRSYITIAHPADGGVVAARVDVEVLRTVLEDMTVGSGSAYVIERDGRIVAHIDARVGRRETSLAGRPELASFTARGDGHSYGAYENFQGRPVYGASVGIADTDLIIVTEVGQEEATAGGKLVLLLVSAGLTVAALVIIGATALFIRQMVFRPIARLQSSARQIAAGDRHIRLRMPPDDEIGQVAASFDQMADAVEDREAAYQQLAESLEQKVAERTDELRRESSQREQLEAETVRQARMLLELSTPLIPVTDEIVALPLIGALDAQRAEQILATMLQGIEQRRAQIAILDVTGVPLIDTQVAGAIIQMEQAVRLLGARVVITGIRPEIAQTLVGLGIDLSRIVTRSTLQGGIEYAIRASAKGRTARG